MLNLNVPISSRRLAQFRLNLTRVDSAVLLSFLADQLLWRPIPRAQVMAEVEAELVRRELAASA